MNTADSGLRIVDYLTLAAIVTGPIVAVFITRWLDDRRARQARRMEIFRTLMRTRRAPMSADHVGALNLVEIEFAQDAIVISTWKDLFKHFGTEHLRKEPERALDIHSQEEKIAREREFGRRIGDERQKLLARLLHAIGARLRFRAEQLELFEGGYLPQGWVDVEEEQRTALKYIVDLYFGRRLLPVGVVDYVERQPSGTEASGLKKAA